MPPPTKKYYSLLEQHRRNHESEPEEEFDELMRKAKHWKHDADQETDVEQKTMMYLQAMLYFCLTANYNEAHAQTGAYTIYKQTLEYMKYITGMVENQNFKLHVLSLRCQSLLYLRLYKLRRKELIECQEEIGKYIQQASNPSNNQVSPNAAAAAAGNNVSPTPSPAGSEGSVCSKSSGYTSAGADAHPASPSGSVSGAGASGLLSVPRSVMEMQHEYCNYLSQCHEMWELADVTAQRGHCEDFVVRLDHTCDPLTLHSSIKDLVHYTREGLKMLSKEKEEQQH